MYEQPFNPYAANLAVIKGYFKQTKVLIIGILYIVSAIISIITSVITVSRTGQYINDAFSIFKSFGLDPGVNENEIRQIVDAVSASSVTSTLPSIIVSAGIILLTAAAFIIMYVKSRSDAPESGPKAGVTILYVLAVISLVFTIIGLVGTILLVILFMYLAGTISSIGSDSIDIGNGYQLNIDGAAISVIVIVLGIFLLLVMIYSLIVAVSQKRYYGSIKASLNTVELQNKGAKAYGVLCIINAVFVGLSVFSSVYALMSFTSAGLTSLIPTGILSIVSTVVSFLILIFNAMIALGYKKYIDEMKYGYNGAPYGGQGGYTPAPAYNNVQAPYAAPRQSGYSDGYNDGYNGTSYAPQQDYSPNAQQASSPEPQYESKNICPYCGAPTDGAPFCGNCGAKL